jgi:hypothetical protein
VRKDRFVIGYRAEKNCIYGKEPPESNISPMSLRQAQRKLKRMPMRGAAIFKLVPLKAGR